MYYCAMHGQSVPAEKIVSFQHGFTIMLDFSPYFKDVVEESY